MGRISGKDINVVRKHIESSSYIFVWLSGKKNTLAQSERSISCFRKTACWKEKSMSFALHTILNFIVPRKNVSPFCYALPQRQFRYVLLNAVDLNRNVI